MTSYAVTWGKSDETIVHADDDDSAVVTAAIDLMRRGLSLDTLFQVRPMPARVGASGPIGGHSFWFRIQDHIV